MRHRYVCLFKAINIPFPDDDALLWCSTSGSSRSSFDDNDDDFDCDDDNDDGATNNGIVWSPSTFRILDMVVWGEAWTPPLPLLPSPSHVATAPPLSSSTVAVVIVAIDDVIVKTTTKNWASAKGFLHGSHIAALLRMWSSQMRFTGDFIIMHLPPWNRLRRCSRRRRLSSCFLQIELRAVLFLSMHCHFPVSQFNPDTSLDT